MFRSQALLGSKVWGTSGSCGGHKLLPPKVLLGLWNLLDAGLH